MNSVEICNVHLPFPDSVRAGQLWNVLCDEGKVLSVNHDHHDHVGERIDADGKGLLLPSLCHSHIHLDKCYILENGEPLITGDFQEALRITNGVKSKFCDTLADLYDRGRRLILESVEAGVTCMRAHVEVDAAVDQICLSTALRLKDDLKHLCDVQISVFAQEPLYTLDGSASVNLVPLLAAACVPGVESIGSAPYVEPTPALAKQNIDTLVALAQKHQLHLDFHLDYTLALDSEPLIHYVVSYLHAHCWSSPQRVTIGHATRITTFNHAQLHDLRTSIGDLPISFVGLPQSDLYIMGRPAVPNNDEFHYDTLGNRPRGTINVPLLTRTYHLDVAMSVNNVGNAFTPQGTPDPLALCPLGVAVYQVVQDADCRLLLDAISLSSKRAIGCASPRSLEEAFAPGSLADFVLLHDNDSVQSAVLAPSYARTTIKNGRTVWWRRTDRWTAPSGAGIAR